MATILIADDSRLMQRNLTMTLQQAGYDILLASDGMEALSVCSKHTPDLLILDCIMPGMSGPEACRIIRSNPTTQHLPILLMSTEDRELRQSHVVGAHDTLHKPIETKELLSKVNKLLAPLPASEQQLHLKVGEAVIDTHLVRVLGGKTIALPPLPDASLKANQQLTIEYDAPGGLRISRDVSVHALLSDATVLALGTNVTLEQRRRHFRKHVEVPVRYRLPGDFYRLGQTLDVSGGGMRLSGVGGQPEVGLTLDFQIVIDPSVFITVQGIIRRIIPSENDRFEIGVEFLAIDPNVQQELTMFLFSHAGEPAESESARA